MINELWNELRPESEKDMMIIAHLQLGIRYGKSEREILVKLVKALAKQKKELQDSLQKQHDFRVVPASIIVKNN